MAVRIIHLKNGEKKYEAYFQLEGKRYQKRFATRAEAREWTVLEKRHQEDMSRSLTFSQAADEYLQDNENKVESNTFREKMQHLREFAQYIADDFLMNELTIEDCRRFANYIQQKRGNKSANRRVRTLKAMWIWCKERVKKNPWREVKGFPQETFVKYLPPESDIKLVFEAAEDWEKDLLMLILNTGARVSEILNLKWSDVFDDNIQLWTKKRKDGSRQPRRIPIGSSLKEILKRYADRGYNNDYVLIHPVTLEPFRKSQTSIKFMLKRLCRKAKVKPFGFHSLRHYFASCLLDTGKTGLADIQLLLGHQRMTTTDTYLHSLNPKLGHLADIIENMNASLNR